MELFEVHLPFFTRYAEIYNPLPVENPLFVVFWLVLYAAFLRLLNWAILKRERLRIHFYITDFWAATLALLPALYLLIDLTDADSALRWRQLGHFCLAFFSTLGGIYAWLILSLPKAGAEFPGRWTHFISVLGGGLAGLAGLFLTGFAFAMLPGFYFVVQYGPSIIFYTFYYGLVLFVVAPPLFLLGMGFFYVQKKAFEALFR